jgi:hypothetical protein
MNLQKAPANLFASVKAKETATTKKDKKTLQAPDLGEKVRRFSELKQQIEAATGELKMIEGDIKTAGRSLYLSEYRSQRSAPDNFKIQDETGASCMFIVMDKYTAVDEDKAEILRNFDGLLSENVTYKFNPDLVEKYGTILSELILNCQDIDDADKGQLISGERTYGVQKGSIDRLLQYDNPEQVFELINPIVALKK